MKNKKALILIILVVLVAAVAFAAGALRKPKKEEKKETKTEEKQEKEFTTYMPATYKVCDEDSCIHISGSYHMGDKRITKLDQKIIDIFDNSDYLALEIEDDTDSVDQSQFLMKDGKTLQDVVTPEFYAKLEKFSEEHPMYVLKAYQNYNLGFNSTVIETLPLLEAKATTPGMDTIFQKRAKKNNKEILAFETMDFQLNLLTGYSDEFYMQTIEYFIDNYDEAAKLQLDLYEAYLKADVDEMLKLLAEDEEIENGEEATEEQIKFYEAMYTNRNNHMTDVIKEYLADNKNVFVVVGAAHVLPEGGILDQLKQTGNYTITRVE